MVNINQEVWYEIHVVLKRQTTQQILHLYWSPNDQDVNEDVWNGVYNTIRTMVDFRILGNVKREIILSKI